MIGIEAIGSYICENKEDNYTKIFNGTSVDADFIKNKIGIDRVSRKKQDEKCSDLCMYAFDDLCRNYDIDINEIGLICVCTQNGDYGLPHTSAVLHSKLNAPNKCAVFDINLGCSGYVYSIDLIKSFMEQNNIKKGLLFTSDAYSSILDKNDKNTSLIFGDASTVTLLSDNPVYELQKSSYYSYGEYYDTLIKKDDEPLYMNGKMIFNFSLINVPDVINDCLQVNALSKEDIDYFVLHQANKYMVEKLVNRLKIPQDKVPLKIKDYGNTVSSSIPIVLSEIICARNNHLLLCGFGVGLSIASIVIRKVK